MTDHVRRAPSERAGRPSRWPATIIPLVVALSTLALLLWSVWPVVRPARVVDVAQAMPDRSHAALPAATTTTTPRQQTPTVQAPGWLEAEPYAVAATALADGVVESIHALEGDYVEKGQIVARLIDDDSQLRLRRAEAALDAANAALELAEAERRAAERAWTEPVELERAAETGRAALDEAQAELAQLPSLVASAQAHQNELEEIALRVRHSMERGATNEIELVVAEQKAAAQRAQLEALEARRPILTARADRLRADLRAASRDLELRIEDRRRLDAANANVASASAHAAHAHAVRDEAQLELERMVIRAPISGYVQHRYKAPGDKVLRMMDDPSSAHLVRLYDPQRLQVRVDVPLADASSLDVGQECEIIVDVLPDRAFRGEVLRITHEADLQKNTLQAKVKVIDPDPILRPQMLSRVKFLPARRAGERATTTPESAASRVLVPVDAIDERRDPARVWIVTQRRNHRGVLASRPVNIIERNEHWLTVSGDLQPGAWVAVRIHEPREGARVVTRRATERENQS